MINFSEMTPKQRKSFAKQALITNVIHGHHFSNSRKGASRSAYDIWFDVDVRYPGAISEAEAARYLSQQAKRVHNDIEEVRPGWFVSAY